MKTVGLQQQPNAILKTHTHTHSTQSTLHDHRQMDINIERINIEHWNIEHRAKYTSDASDSHGHIGHDITISRTRINWNEFQVMNSQRNCTDFSQAEQETNIKNKKMKKMKKKENYNITAKTNKRCVRYSIFGIWCSLFTHNDMNERARTENIRRIQKCVKYFAV